MTLNDKATHILRQVIVKYGISICDDPRRCQSFLNDLCGEYGREISLLITAVQESIPDQLLNSKNLPSKLLKEKLVRQLTENRSIEQQAALWTVNAWAFALDAFLDEEYAGYDHTPQPTLFHNLAKRYRKVIYSIPLIALVVFVGFQYGNMFFDDKILNNNLGLANYNNSDIRDKHIYDELIYNKEENYDDEVKYNGVENLIESLNEEIEEQTGVNLSDTEMNDGVFIDYEEDPTTIKDKPLEERPIAIENENTTTVKVTGINLNYNNLSLISGGQTGYLAANIVPVDATNKDIIWHSSDISIATVKNGVITPLKEGTVVIKATTKDGGYFAVCNVKMESNTDKNLETIIIFPDWNLEKAIRDKINKPSGDIYISDVENITSLTANYTINLEGLQYLQNMREFSNFGGVNYSKLADISPIARLTNLTNLSLINHDIKDVSPLSELRNLKTLRIYGNKISDLTPLSYCTNLEELWLFSNNISDLTPLSRLSKLTKLGLGYNQISDIHPLKNLTNLVDLRLHSNKISDISPVSNLRHLTYLNLINNQISNIEPLINLTKLELLPLNDNQISNIHSLRNLTNLIELRLHNNQISDIGPLINLTNLTYLTIDTNNISDFSPIQSYYHNLKNKDTIMLP